MKFTIAQIGQNRLKKVLMEDREQSPEKLCNVLQSDFLNVASSYMEQPEVKIETYEDEEDIVFAVKISTKRIKSVGVLRA